MTPTQRAAMEQALDCLEQLQGGCTDSDDGTVEAITVWCPEIVDALRAALAEQPDVETCEVPPLGWHCTRHAGHEGPCAAVANDDRELVSRAMKRLAEQPAEQEPFQPDWVNYRQGLRDGWTEGYEQGIADERTSAANIGIAGFDAKVHPARVNPYESTAPNPTKSAEQEPVAPARHSEIALMEKAVKRVGMVSLLNHGAASCVYTEGCEGVSQDHLLAYTREIALHCAAALLQTVAPDAPQQEGETA